MASEQPDRVTRHIRNVLAMIEELAGPKVDDGAHPTFSTGEMTARHCTRSSIAEIPQVKQFSGPRTSTGKDQLNFLALPVDIHFAIFKKLHLVTATCLGLTNSKLYAILKAVYADPISLCPHVYSSHLAKISYEWVEFGLLGTLISGGMKPRLLWDHFYFLTPERYEWFEDGHHKLSL